MSKSCGEEYVISAPESLVAVPEDQWPPLLRRLEIDWPRYLPAFYSLQMQIDYPTLKEYTEYSVYAPFGNLAEGIITTCLKGTFLGLTITCQSKDANKLVDAIEKSKRIDWSKHVLVIQADDCVLPRVHQLRLDMSLQVKFEVPTHTYLLSRDSKSFDDIIFPPDTYVGPLKQEHTLRVDQAWPHRHPNSDNFFALLIDSGLSYGIFNENHDLLAWILINEHGFLNHLYCEEKYRKRGYAEVLTKYVSNYRLGQGKDVYCYVLDNNIASTKLFGKLGFKIIGAVTWIGLSKNDS